MNTENSNKTTDMLIPVKGIVNGMIELDSKEKVAGVKITPRNIFILDESAQFSVIDNLKNFYNTLDFEFWLIVADRPVDISVYLAQLQALYNSSQDSVARKLISEDLKKAADFASENVTDVEFYILFKDKNIDVVQKRIRLLINGLATSGLVAAQANNEDLRTLLDNFLNGGITTNFGTVMA